MSFLQSHVQGLSNGMCCPLTTIWLDCTVSPLKSLFHCSFRHTPYLMNFSIRVSLRDTDCSNCLRRFSPSQHVSCNPQFGPDSPDVIFFQDVYWVIVLSASVILSSASFSFAAHLSRIAFIWAEASAFVFASFSSAFLALLFDSFR